MNPTTWGINFRDGEDWVLSTTRSNGAMLIASDWSVDWDHILTRSSMNTATSEISSRLTFIHPSDDQQPGLSGLTRKLTAYGWPRLALWSGYERRRAVGIIQSSASWTIRSGIRITGEQFAQYPGSAVPRTLPYRPIWPGFAINAVFYAAILWLLALGPLTARRIFRHKRGHCIKCGYDLRSNLSSGCPECGWQRASET